MNSPLKIYSGSNVLLYTTPINTGCRRRVQLMSEDSITVKFSDRSKMKFPIGTRIGDFYITEEQQERYNAATGGYDYELKFNAYYWLWANKLLFYVMPGVDNAPKETSFKLTATIDVHAAVILRALNACGFTYDNSPFRVDTDEDFSTEAKYISYEGLSILDGIQAIAEAYECEWWVVGNSIHFGKCSSAGEYEFVVGENVSSITSDSKEVTANRLHIYGSTRNLPSNYRDAGASDIVDAIVVRRLMLPEGIPYLQTFPDIPEDEIVEEEIILDSVYPRTALTITDVVTYDSTVDGTTQTFYRIKYGTSFLFSKDYILPEEELHVVFESGSLNGMDFAVRFNPLGAGEEKDDGTFNPEAQMLEIVVNEDYGRALPDGVLHPAVGDKFSLYGWDSTKMADLGLLGAAEQELLEEGNKLVDEYRKDKHTYTCPMMWDWCKNQADQNNSPKLGSTVNLHFTTGDAGRKSRIIGYEHNLDIEYSNVTYTCGEKVSVSRLKTLESKVEGLTHDGSKAKVQNSLDFLSKRYSDRTPYQIASDMGFEIGNYLAGVSGGMFGIDKTDGESFVDVFKLFVRGKAYFETLTTIESATLAGKQYITPGGAIKCSKVEEIKNDAGAVTAYRCYFLSEQDGEKTETKIIAGDQVISEMFNANTETTNKISNHRYWRLVTAVNNDAYPDESGNHYGYIDLSATDCETDSDVPKEGDVIEQFGNRTDKTRQGAMVFSTVDPDSPSIKLLAGIDSYSLVGKDIISQGYDHGKGHAFFKCYGDTYIGASDGSTYVKYDQDTKQLDIKAKLNIGSTIDGKTLNDYFTGLIPEIEQEDIEGFVNAIVDPKLEGIQDQIDGVIESFFGFGAPTRDNYPANEWTTDEARKAHERDTYTDKTEYVDDATTPTAGQSWKWQYTSPTDYGWVKIADSDAVKALLDAAKAQDTANNKRRVFIQQPTPPYDKGDLWVNATYGTQYSNDILRCITKKADGESFKIADWTLASKYTDDTLAQKAIDSIADYEYLKEAIVNGASQTFGGLFLSSYIKLGTWNKSNPDKPVFDTPWSGLNGVYVNGRTPSYFAGGDMIDRFDAQDNPLNVAGTRYATSMVRMDGSAYFANGLVGFRKNGSGWLAGDNIRWDEHGTITFGNGIKIDLGGGGNTTLGDLDTKLTGVETSLATVLALANKLSNLFTPFLGNAQKNWDDISTNEDYDSVRVNVGLWTESFLSCLGLNSSGSGGGGGGFGLMREWPATAPLPTTNDALGANLGYDLWLNKADKSAVNAIASRVATLEGKNYLDALTLVTSGSGNAVTSVSLSADKKTLTVNKDANFLTAHQSLANYYTKSEVDTKDKRLTTYYAVRPASANVNFGNAAGLYTFLATSVMTTGKPAVDSHILHMEWDNSLAYAAQIALPAGVDASMQWRWQHYTTWQAWRTLLDTNNYAGTLDTRYVTLNTAQTIAGVKTFASDRASALYVGNTGVTSPSDFVAIKFMHTGAEIGGIASSKATNMLYRVNGEFSKAWMLLDTGNYAATLDTRYVTLNTDQTITGVKTFIGAKLKVAGNNANYIHVLRSTNAAIPTSDRDYAWQFYHWAQDGENRGLSIWSYDGDSKVYNHVATFKAHPWNSLVVNGAIIKSGGTSSQFLMADGSLATKVDIRTITHLSYGGDDVEATRIPTMNVLAHWNGRYDSSNSNLQYCDKGRFGDIVTHSHSEYVTALGTSGDYLTWTKNGVVNNITVPFATTAARLIGFDEHTGTGLSNFDTTYTRTYQATNDLGDGISYMAILSVSAGSVNRYFQIIGGKGNTSYLRWRTTNADASAMGPVHRILDDLNYAAILDSRYLKLTGGTITGSSGVPLIVNTTYQWESGIRFSTAGTSKGFVGYSADYGVILSNHACNKYIGVTSAGIPVFSGSTLLHAGNYASFLDSVYVNKAGDTMTGTLLAPRIDVGDMYWDGTGIMPSTVGHNKYVCGKADGRWANVFTRTINVTSTDLVSNLNADMLDGYHDADFFRSTIGGYGSGVNSDNILTALPGNRSGSYYVPLTGMAYAGAAFVLYAHSSCSGLAFYRPGGSNSMPKILVSLDSSSNWTDKGTILTTSEGNAVSATKLLTARTVWGKSFNGTENLSGDIELAMGNASSNNNSGKLWFNGVLRGQTTQPVTGPYMMGMNVGTYGRKRLGVFQHNADSYTIEPTEVLSILPSGNVGIGTTSPAYKLDVNGIVRATGEIIANSPNAFRAVGGNYGFFIRNDGNHTYFMLTNSGDAYGSYNSLRPMYIVNSSGVVGLGRITVSGQSDFNSEVNIYADVMIDSMLHVMGEIYSEMGIYSDGFVSARGRNTSDVRLKTDLRDFRASDIIRALRPVAFRWNELARSRFKVFDTDAVQYGLIAQEVLETAPWLVQADMFKDGYMGVWYDKLIPVLLKGEIEILRVTEDHEERIKALERENEELRKEIIELQTR